MRASLLAELSTLSSLVTIDGFFLAQASLELTTNDLEFLILLPSAGTTSMYHHAWLLAHFFLICFIFIFYFLTLFLTMGSHVTQLVLKCPPASAS